MRTAKSSRMRNALIATSLILLLSACSNTRTVYVPSQCPIPANLTDPLLVPMPQTTNGRLTYSQAVLWIDPLLTLLDRANNDRAAIRQLPHQQPTQQDKP